MCFGHTSTRTATLNLALELPPNIAVSIPTTSSNISAKVGRYSSQNSNDGFDEYLLIGGFKIKCFDINQSNLTIGGINPFNKVGWSKTMSSPKFSSNVNDIVELANYLMIKTDNLLLFVNGYRENLVDDINMNEDYENSDNLIRYVDDFPNSGSYWQERGEKFMLKIGTQNVVYADGHHKIYTSNHWVDDNLNKIQDDEDIRASKLKFATGMKGSLCAGNFAIPAAIGVITQGLVTGCVSPNGLSLQFVWRKS